MRSDASSQRSRSQATNRRRARPPPIRVRYHHVSRDVQSFAPRHVRLRHRGPHRHEVLGRVVELARRGGARSDSGRIPGRHRSPRQPAPRSQRDSAPHPSQPRRSRHRRTRAPRPGSRRDARHRQAPDRLLGTARRCAPGFRPARHRDRRTGATGHRRPVLRPGRSRRQHRSGTRPPRSGGR